MDRVSGGLSEITEQTMIEAHQSGMTYWRRNRPVDATKEDLASLARSCGWHGADCEAWLAGFFGAKRRAVTDQLDEALQTFVPWSIKLTKF